MNYHTDWIAFFRLSMPQLVLFFTSVVVLLVGAFKKQKQDLLAPILTGLGLAAAFFLSWNLWLHGGSETVGMLSFTRFTFFAWMLTLLAAFFSLLLSYEYLQQRKSSHPEFYGLLLLATVGMGCLVAGSDLLMIFIGLETMSIAVYPLAGFLRERPQANEAALKYFITGAFASAFLLMGIAFLFGTAGTTDLATISQNASTYLSGEKSPFFLFGIALTFIGFAFKIAAVPFHAWAPDVYDGAPTPVTNFMATAVKAAAVLALLRLAAMIFSSTGELWVNLMCGAAAVTMLLGNIAALSQDNLKRMLAYSSIAHVGYLLVAFATLPDAAAVGSTAIMFYLVVYVLMSAGAFAIVIACQAGRENTDVNSLAGLSKKRPCLAAMFAIFMLSLAGFPPTVGFFAKYYLFLAAVKSGLIWLVVLGLINSAISAYYYLRPIVVMYFHPENTNAPENKALCTPLVAVIAVAALFVIFFGLFPSNLLDFVKASMF